MTAEHLMGSGEWAYPGKMTRFSLLLAASILFSCSQTVIAKADTPGLVCPLVPVLTESFLKTHVAIKNASDEIHTRTADQMIQRLDPSKVILLDRKSVV